MNNANSANNGLGNATINLKSKAEEQAKRAKNHPKIFAGEEFVKHDNNKLGQAEDFAEWYARSQSMPTFRASLSSSALRLPTMLPSISTFLLEMESPMPTRIPSKDTITLLMVSLMAGLMLSTESLMDIMMLSTESTVVSTQLSPESATVSTQQRTPSTKPRKLLSTHSELSCSNLSLIPTFDKLRKFITISKKPPRTFRTLKTT
eukprot:CAMPEP_0116870360 /NCGR_PEP_ID=MMETSP0463-20121206/238_1 /TAXON_ID=181622 /ORGANISM="Strombidinopsis sp, Strain SopsisLIS2011" /LENGTH=204 /DNA_ID=CAMNT_0004506759 /DNA_START=124 /DNA_END=739 /DNA_ORIENTATION=+